MSRLPVAGSMSTNTGVAPVMTTEAAVVEKVKLGTITSSPGASSSNQLASSRACVPEPVSRTESAEVRSSMSWLALLVKGPSPCVRPRAEQRLWHVRWQLNRLDRRRSLSHYWTSPSHQFWRTQGEKQPSHSYKQPGQTVKAAGLARTMSEALELGSDASGHRSLSGGTDLARYVMCGVGAESG